MSEAPYAPPKACEKDIQRSLSRSNRTCGTRIARGCGRNVSTLATAFAAWAALLLPQSATAETFRCGSKIVTKAISVTELVRLCGQPREKTVTEVEPRGSTVYGYSRLLPKVKTETWIYDRGSQSYGMRVTILDGKITRMESIK